MIIVRINMRVLPEKHKEFLQTLLSMIEPAEKEAGCLSYGVFCDIENKYVFSLISEWKNRRYLARHMRSDIFGVLLGSKTLLCEPHTIQINTVSRSEGMEAVHEVRNKP